MASTEMRVVILCSPPEARRTSLSAALPVSTQIIPGQASAPRSFIAAAFSVQGFHTMLEAAPSFSMTMRRRHSASSMTACRGADKAVLRRLRLVAFRPEPRKDDRDPAADRGSRRENGVRAGEDDRPLAGRLPGCHGRPLQEQFAPHAALRHHGFDQPALLGEIDHVADPELGGKLLRIHRGSPFWPALSWR